MDDRQQPQTASRVASRGRSAVLPDPSPPIDRLPGRVPRPRRLDPALAANEREVRAILSRFTYRPGWQFVVEDGYLKVYASLVDATNPKETIPLVFGRMIPRYDFTHGFEWTRWLFEQVREIEMHEVQEFFRIDGKCVYEPHPELAPVGVVVDD